MRKQNQSSHCYPVGMLNPRGNVLRFPIERTRAPNGYDRYKIWRDYFSPTNEASCR